MTAGRAAAGLLGLMLLPALCGSQPRPAETVTPRFSHALPSQPDRVMTTVIVEFAPGARAAPHRHGDAFVYAYVLAGEVRSALNGDAPRVYAQGSDWFEPPGAHHVLTENASEDRAARLLVVFVHPAGAPLKPDDVEKSP